jgi:hypothetical protein
MSIRGIGLAGGLLLLSAAVMAQTQTPAPTAPAQQTTSRVSKRLPELIIGNPDGTYGVNMKDFELVAGQGYRWKISSNGGPEYKFHTTLFRNVWMNQIVVEGLEVHMNGAPAWLEFDEKGTMLVEFTTVRPGEYEWWIAGLEDKGMKGKIVIK